MSGYQIPNNQPNYFIPNGQSELLQQQVDFLLNGFSKPTETEHVVSGTTDLYLECEECLQGFVVVSGTATVTLYLPTGADLFDCLQSNIYGNQSILVNPPAVNRVNYFQLTRGFGMKLKIFNNTSNTLTIYPQEFTSTVARGGSIPAGQVGIGEFTVIATGDSPKMAFNIDCCPELDPR